jgi:hypothetical protein
VCVDPAYIPTEGILPARALTRVECSTSDQAAHDVRLTRWLPSHLMRACVMLANFSDQTLTVPKSTVLGIAEEMSEPLVGKIH